MTAIDRPITRQTPPDIRPDPAAPPALSIDGISHSYGSRRALIDINFTVAPASFTALLGLNGAGKSTLFSLVTRLFGIQSGRIGIFGHDIGQAPGEALRLLGVVFQPRTLDLDLSVTQNLLYHASLHGIARREARLRSGEVLTRIGLSDRAGSKVRDLSGGQMRRLEIARALLHRPHLLLLDEATVGLTSRHARIFWATSGNSSPNKASACSGPPICSTRSCRAMTSWCCIRAACWPTARFHALSRMPACRTSTPPSCA
jgi:ABC-2 type transport system ATP-binding protein